MEVITILFKNFTNNSPALIPNKGLNRFQRLRLNTRNKKRAVIVFVIFILIMGLTLPLLFRSQSTVIQKYDLVLY